jgi:type VI secretion system protein ImpE
MNKATANTEPLDETLQKLQSEVKKQPGSVKLRMYLFQLLCIVGQWERAEKQLKVVGKLDPEAIAMVHTYRTALACEFSRQKVFDGETAPIILGEAQHWMHLLTDAFHLTLKGDYEASQAVRIEALEVAPALSGSIDGDLFAWFGDLDTRLAFMLEAIVGGKYYWIPFHRIREIRTEQPVNLRDVVWLPARFTWTNGGESAGLIPTRYPGSERNQEDDIRMARKTDWIKKTSDVYLGQGQRLFATESADYALMDTRLIRFDELKRNSAKPSDV